MLDDLDEDVLDCSESVWLLISVLLVLFGALRSLEYNLSSLHFDLEGQEGFLEFVIRAVLALNDLIRKWVLLVGLAELAEELNVFVDGVRG